MTTMIQLPLNFTFKKYLPLGTSSGQAVLESTFALFGLLMLLIGLIVFAIGLSVRAIAAYALEERLVCQRSVQTRALCNNEFQNRLKAAPGDLQLIHWKGLTTSTLKAHFRWSLHNHAFYFQIQENSPLAYR